MRATPKQPNPAYFTSLGVGLTGLALVSTGLWAAVEALVGGDPANGIGHGGLVGLAIAFVLVYVERASRWERVSPRLQQLAQQLLAIALVVSLLCTAVCLYLAFSQGDTFHLSTIFGLSAAVCQVGSVYWLYVARPRTFPVAG